MKKLNIMVVDDSKAICALLQDQLEEWGHTTTVLDCGDKALAVLQQEHFDVVITDLNMPGRTDGIGLLEFIKQHYPEVDVIILTGYASVENTISALRQGATDYLTKPFNFDHLLISLERIRQRQDMAAMLKHTERNKEQGIHQMEEIISSLHKKCSMLEKILRKENEGERARIAKALELLSE